MRAPDYAAPILGWRVWRVGKHGSELRLLSALQDEVWEPRDELAARCRPHEDFLAEPSADHPAPAGACSCGIYGTREPAEAARYLLGRDDSPVLHRVIGQVALWGTVVEGPAGWRASRGYPARIWIPLRRADGSAAPTDDVAEALADYGVPLELLDSHRPSDVGSRLALAGPIAA